MTTDEPNRLGTAEGRAKKWSQYIRIDFPADTSDDTVDQIMRQLELLLDRWGHVNVAVTVGGSVRPATPGKP
jgi:hypothetical protein